MFWGLVWGPCIILINSPHVRWLKRSSDHRSRGRRAVLSRGGPVVADRFRSRGLRMPDATELKTPKSKSGQWHSVAVVHDRVSIKGGYNSRFEAGRCIQYQAGDTIHTFVELDKNATWFLKGVGGAKTQKGDLKPVHVIDMLRHSYKIKVTCDPNAGAAVAEGSMTAVAASPSDGQAPTDDVDPMDALDSIAEAKTPPKAKPDKTKRGLFRAEPQRLEVATRPPCAACREGDTTAVWVYQAQKGQSLKTRQDAALFLRVDSIGWLLAYAADELHLQGVRASRPDPSTEKAPNCTAVADLHLEYVFGKNLWQGTFLAGTLVGTVKRLAIKDLNKDMWQKLKEESKVDGYVTTSDFRSRKDATKEWLTLWCAAVARSDAEAADMEAMLHPQTNRGQKRSLEGTAGAEEDSGGEDAAVAEDDSGGEYAAVADDLHGPSDSDAASGDDELTTSGGN
jgi:hypothetical protein